MEHRLSLEIVEGPGAGRVVPLTGPLEIGRDPAAALRLDDEHVSPFHARISLADGGAFVEDLGDPGGTFVNDAELRASTRIGPGDEIQVGVTVLRLRPADAPAAARPKPPPPTDSVAMAEVEELLDVRVKSKARHAPLAVLVLVVYAVLLYLALSRL